MRNSEKTKISLFHILTLTISCSFFLGIVLIDGPIWCVDSNSYVTMDITREPVYPLFLMFLRNVFGDAASRNDLPFYLMIAAFLQSFLWIYTTCRITFYIYNRVSSWKFRDKNFLPWASGFAALFFQLAVPAFNRFAIKRQSMYSESIMTESLAMPLFALICLRLCLLYRDHKRKDLIILLLEAFLIISIRKQMMVVLILWASISFLCDVLLKNTRNIRRFFLTMALLAAVFMASNLLDRTYNYCVRGVFITHTGNYQGELCTLIYTADEEDIELFNDNNKFDGEKELYTKIYRKCVEENLLYATYDAADWKDLTSHYSDSYDIIGYDILMPMCYEYVDEMYPGISEVERRTTENEIEGDLASHLIKQEKGDLLHLYAANLLRAFVYSNASMHPDLFIVASLIFYFFYNILIIMTLLKTLKKKAGENSSKPSPAAEALLFSIIVLMALSINSGVVAALIFPQGRYMIYSTALFYTAMLFMGVSNLSER